TPRKEIDTFKSQIKEKFEMSDLGLLAYYLGIEVTQTGGEITIKQTGYINKILKETSMMDSNETKIPMDPGTKLVKGEDGNPKQPTVALSSCESEFMAATGAACQALWLKRLLSELTGWKEERITLKVDNVLAIILVRNPVFHGRKFGTSPGSNRYPGVAHGGGLNGFKWGETEGATFSALKGKLTHAPILGLPDFEDTFVIEADASDVGIGAVLLQKEQPLGYFSRKLGPRMKVAATYQKELFAIVKAQKYVKKLMGFDFGIEYKSRASNLVADALSRVHEDNDEGSNESKLLFRGKYFIGVESKLKALLLSEFHVTPNAGHEGSKKMLVGRGVEVDPKKVSAVSGWPNGFKWGETEGATFSALKGKLTHAPILGLPDFEDTFVIEADASDVGIGAVLLQKDQPLGHEGSKKMLVGLSALFYWKGMRNSVKGFIRKCLVCQQTKYTTQAMGGLLQPLPTPTAVWEDISMDFITGLPLSKGFTDIFVVVDRFTKYAHFGTLPTSFNSSKVAELFMDMVVKHHGFLKTIVSDQDPIFTDGQTQVVNRGLEQYLRAMVLDRPYHWVHLLSWAEYSYNTSFHSSIKMTPFQALYGRMPPSYRQVTLAKHLSNKLSKRYYGPYEVLERVGKVAYQLDLHAESRIHPVFHVSLLKPFAGTVNEGIANLPEEVHEGQPMEQPLAVCASRVVLRNEAPTRQILVQWLGNPPEEVTWEWLSEFEDTYPSHHIEGNVISKEENVTTQGVGWPKRAKSKPTWQKDYVM
nr:hypothetical protein [Tanacetum cinerariifolium]